MTLENNQIERDIFIVAPVNKVWSLIQQPAWWVGDAPGPDKVQVSGSHIVADTKYGKFPVVVERIDAPTYLACRWASTFPGEEPRPGNSTLVEFFLKEENGGTRLRVVESGFATLDLPSEAKETSHRENTHGWAVQLDVLRGQAEQQAK